MKRGGYIKLDVRIHHGQDMFALSLACGFDKEKAVGRVTRFWCYFFEHTADWSMPAKFYPGLCEDFGSDFMQAMLDIGWLKKDDEKLWLPNPDNWLGSTGKAMREKQRDKKRLQRADSQSHTAKPSKPARTAHRKPQDVKSTWRDDFLDDEEFAQEFVRIFQEETSQLEEWKIPPIQETLEDFAAYWGGETKQKTPRGWKSTWRNKLKSQIKYREKYSERFKPDTSGDGWLARKHAEIAKHERTQLQLVSDEGSG